MIKFDINKKKEIEYLKELFSEKEWFDDRNFPVFWPENQNNLVEEVDKSTKLLKDAIIYLEKEWTKIESDFFSIVSKFRYSKQPKKYNCHISYFGVEGRYKSPSNLFVRLRIEKDKDRIIETIAHELLHLFFDPYFYKQKYSYREREWLIDHCIVKSDLSKLFPKYEVQKIGEPKPMVLKRLISNQ